MDHFRKHGYELLMGSALWDIHSSYLCH